ncbi:uncharacterized protein METZ01_LOCUS68784 [marine metagenome]|uniref:Uncharacterized protein n=1 Tax=marine metagenome TaxID=408172 RepID=A0A381TIP8_9ZZZZ
MIFTGILLIFSVEYHIVNCPAFLNDFPSVLIGITLTVLYSPIGIRIFSTGETSNCNRVIFPPSIILN